MRVSRQTLAAHRAAMLDQAARLFRGQGVAPVAVADVTAAAGLTHGAFYGHFPSKAALVAEAVETTLQASALRWHARAEQARAEGRDPIDTLIAGYLSETHRDNPETGCALAALGGELARDPALQKGFAAGVEALAAVLQDELARRRPGAADHRATSLAILAAMNGGLVLARALQHDLEASRVALAGAAAMARQVARPRTI